MDFEREAAEILGLDQTTSSGSKWHDRSDGRGRIRLSCKSTTTRRSWGEARAQLDEAVDMAAGTGETPALALEDPDGARFLLLRIEDAATLLTDEARAERVPRRSQTIRDTASTPILLRSEDEN